MKSIIVFLLTILFFSCNSQQPQPIEPTSKNQPIVGGAFENRDFFYIGMPENINTVDTSAGWQQEGQKLLITGTVFQLDGKTPAPNVVLYYYHTDIEGLYSATENLDQRVARHGYIRGWVKSDQNGQYSIYTVRPAAYPNSNDPAHIHPAIKESNIDYPYHIDGFVFDDDVLLTSAKRKALENRGGSGVLRVRVSGDVQIAEHNIILGLNIPDYTENSEEEVVSGRSIGEDVFSFTPYHAWGADKGTKTCPICKYGRYHGILYFVGNQPNWEDIKTWLTYLEQESIERKQYLKAYFIYGNEKDHDKVKTQQQLEEIGEELGLKNVALTFVPSFSDQDSEIYLNRINAEVENTILIYKNRNIVDKFINLEPSKKNFELISNKLDATVNEYFYLPEPKH